MSEQPYPPGTPCVITQCQPGNPTLSVGDIVSVASGVDVVSAWDAAKPNTVWGRHHVGLVLQELMLASKNPRNRNGHVWYPVPWMRPKPPDDELDDIQRDALLDSLRVDVGVVA